MTIVMHFFLNPSKLMNPNIFSNISPIAKITHSKRVAKIIIF